MKQLTKSEFNKSGTTYKSVTSPASDGDFTQISDIGIKDNILAYSTDGENFIKLKQEVVYVDDLSTIYQSPTALPSSADIGTVLPTLNNGEPPVTLYKYNGISWVLVDQAKADTLYYSKQQKLIFTYKTSAPYFEPTSYTNTNQLTNGAAFVNATTMASEINSAVGSEATLRSAADTALQASITALQNNKQDNLTAGDCVSIINNVISATGFKVLASDNVTISTLNKGAYQINAPAGGCDLYYSTQNSIELEGDTTSYLLVTDANKWVLVKDSSVFVGSSTFAKELQTKLTAGANITIVNDTISSATSVVDSALSTTSENPVQNKVVTNALNGKYEKPVGGIPATDLASAVQTSLGKADTALQSISSSDVTNALGFTPYNATNPNGYTKVESSTTNGNIKINGTETTVYTLPNNVATSSDITTVQNDINAVSGRVTTIEGEIPTQASSSNQLADKNFVNSSINAFAAYYITKNAAGDPFATKAQLTSATTFYSGGVVRTPTTNDYCIVLADESKQSSTGVDPTTRYSYQGNQWEYQYTVNDTPLTAAQLAALNSGITSALVTQIGTNQSNISSLSTNKQDALTAGASIDITNNTISVIVDSGLSSTSENPLQNKVVNSSLYNLGQRINGKQDTLTFDTTPTASSTNPVTSGGVYSALASKGGVYRGTFGDWSTVPTLASGYEADANGNTTPLKDDYMILNDGSGKLDDSSFLYLSDTSGSRASIANTYNGNTQSVVYYNASGESNATTLNGVVSVYYNSNAGKWVVKTLKACTFNNATYAVGDTIAQWGYATYAQGYIGYATNTNGGILVYDGVWGTDGKNGWKTAASIISMTTGIQNAINTKQDTLTAGTGITITNNVISSTGGVTVDSALSSTSENPVQNKVINSALGNKLNTSGGAVSGDINYSAGVGSGFNTNTNGKFLMYGATDSLYVQKKDIGGTVTGYFKLMDGNGKLYSQNNEVYTKSMILDFIYPVGSYFVTESATFANDASAVAAHFGGTWVQVTGRFLYGSTTAGTEAGEETHTLTIDEMPSHNHDIKLETGSLTGSSGRVKWAGNGDYQTYPGSILNKGGNQPHNNMPPYRTVYMYRRTA